ncbi:MAG TPA: hypothetical protein VGE52_20725 [Pirellulales bacterium]
MHQQNNTKKIDLEIKRRYSGDVCRLRAAWPHCQKSHGKSHVMGEKTTKAINEMNALHKQITLDVSVRTEAIQAGKAANKALVTAAKELAEIEKETAELEKKRKIKIDRAKDPEYKPVQQAYNNAQKKAEAAWDVAQDMYKKNQKDIAKLKKDFEAFEKFVTDKKNAITLKSKNSLPEALEYIKVRSPLIDDLETKLKAAEKMIKAGVAELDL